MLRTAALLLKTLKITILVVTFCGLTGPFHEAMAQNNANSNSNSNKASNTPSQGQAKRVKFKKDTKVDFDDELIEGGVKNPFQSMIGGRDGDNKAGFIRMRREWHDQMIMSVNGLSQ